MTHYSSKHGTVNRPQAELFMVFTDPRNLTRMVPAEKLGEVTADYDSVYVNTNGVEYTTLGGEYLVELMYSGNDGDALCAASPIPITNSAAKTLPSNSPSACTSTMPAPIPPNST